MKTENTTSARNRKIASTVIRDGDSIITTTVETEVESAVIDFDEILDATVIESDDCFNAAPWEDCDGYEHEVISDDSDGNAAGYFYGERNSHHRGAHRVVVKGHAFKKWGNFGCWRSRGASKQVAFELARAEEKRTAEYIAGCYANGWNVFCVVCRFKDEIESVGGCYASEPTTKGDDASLKETRRDIAHQMVSVLEARGFEVVGQPNRKAEYIANRMDGIKRHLNEQNSK